MFGQQKSGFGSSAFGSTGAGSLFGKTSTTSGGMFGTTGSTGGFGATSNTGGFGGGSGGFGNTSTGSIFGTPSTKTSGGLFGTPSQSFGKPAQSGFGGSSFAQPQTQSLFGSSTPASTASFGGGGGGGGGGLFGASSSFNNQISGTGSAKFAPVSGSDTMMKNGLQQNISTKHQCITAMKEYDSKSFEELRVDDYLANRKGPPGGSSAFAAPSSTTSGFMFGQKATTGTLFGQSSAKPTFGTASTGGMFGTNTASTAGGLFGSSSKPFGTAASSTASGGFSFGGGATGGSLFGNTSKPGGSVFGTTTTTAGGGLFGSSGGSAGSFGTSGFGGGTGGSLFGNKPTTGFGTATSTGFGTTGGGLFGASAKPAGGLFGASTGFGQQPTGNTLFGGNKPAFGAATSAGGGLFGNTLNTGGTQNKGLFSGFGTGSNLGGGTAFNFNAGAGTLGGGTGAFGTGATGFGGSLFGQQATSGTAGALTLPSASNQQSNEVLQALLQAPFGDSPLFKSSLADPSKRQELLKPTNPIAQQAVIQSPLYRISSGGKTKIKPKARSNISPRSVASHGKPHQLFAGLEPEEEADVSNKSFVGRSSVKRLTIKVAPNSSSYPESPRYLSPSPSTPISGKPSKVSPTTSLKYVGESSSSVAKSGEFRSESAKSNDGESLAPGTAKSSTPGTAKSSAIFIPESSKSSLASKPSDVLRRTTFTSQENDQDPKSVRSSMVSAFRQSSSRQNTISENDEEVRPSSTANLRQRPEINGSTPPSLQQFNEEQPASERSSLVNNTMNDLNVPSKLSIVGLGKGPFPDSSTALVDNEAPDEPHPTGIILRRSGYYTIPNMDELASMLDENSRCIITDLTIGRMGYGTVFFPGEVDVTGLNLDEIIHIRRKEITVYPEDNVKPPIGEGLNRPAEVTLDCVWPTDKATRQPVTDIERLINMKWSQKIEQITVKMGARFLEYRPDTGSWVFEVNHFSKYGLPESDDEDEAVGVDQPREGLTPGAGKKLSATKKTSLWSTRTQVDVEPNKRHVGLGGEGVYVGDKTATTVDRLDFNAEEEMIEAYEDGGQTVPPVQDLFPLSHKMALEMGVKPDRLQSMKASFFADDDDEIQTNFSNSLMDMTSLSKPPVLGIDLKPGLLGGQRIHLEGDVQRSSSPMSMLEKRSPPEKLKRLKKATFVDVVSKPLPTFAKANEDDDSAKISLQQSTLDRGASLPRPKMPVVCAPKRNPAMWPSPVYINKENLVCDSSQFLGRSFRVGWGPGWMLAHSGQSLAQPSNSPNKNQFSIFSSTNSSETERDFAVNVELVKCAPHFPSPRDESSDERNPDLIYLHMALRHSDVISNDDTAPRAEPVEDVEILRKFADNARQDWESVDPTHPDAGFTLACHVAFGLCKTLWGNIEESAGLDSKYAEQMRRKRMLVSWLTSAIEAESIVERKHRTPSRDSCTDVFQLVSDGRLDKAVKFALDNGNGRLACLLSSSCSSATSSVAVAKQLVEWVETEADKYISETTLRLYCLLAAKPTWLSGRGSINTCSGLDWKRSLLLHLTFLSEPVSPLNDGVQLYKTAWKGESEFGVYSAAPVPSYIECKREYINAEMKEECPVRDISYHLIQLYCKGAHRFDTTLCPSSIVPHPLDYRLSWLVWRLLNAAGYKSNMKESSITSLHLSYAAQLESRGLWHQAVFVLTHLSCNRKRELAIRNLLGRYVSSNVENQTKQVSFVVDELGIPESWLHECRALSAKSSGAHHKVALNLLKAGNWQLGHDSLMKDVAADALIHDRHGYLLDMLTMFEKADVTAYVRDWENAGKVYLEFLVLKKQIRNLKTESSSREVEMEFENLWPRVTALCQRVADLKCRSAKDRLARAEMATQTLNLYNVMHSMLKQHELTSPYDDLSSRGISRAVPTSVIASQTSRMNLPTDYAIQDLAKIVESHFIEIVMLRKQSE